MPLADHLQPDEAILYRARPSRMPLAVPAAAAVLALLAGLALWRLAGRLEPLALGGATAVAALLWTGVRFVRLLGRVYALTDRRVIRQEGLLDKASKDAYLDKINNVEHRQTLAGRIFGYGDLEIDTASETGRSLFSAVADPLAFKRAILAAADRARSAGRGVATSGAERLRDLKRLHDDGLITDAEFEKKRAELVERL